MSEEKNLPKWIPVVAAITTLSVPFLYIFGYAFDQGYLHTYGLSNEFFARSHQEYLAFAFFACLFLATDALELFTDNIPLFIGFALIFGGIASATVIAYKPHIDNQQHSKLVFTKEHWLFNYTFFAFFSFFSPFLLITAIFAVLLVPIIFYFEGKHMAVKEIKNTKTCIYSSPPIEECVSLLENGKPIAIGKFVARSPSHIALFNQGKTTIYPVKDQLVEIAPASKKPK